MRNRDDLIQPGPFCAPCIKEEICNPKAAANLAAGHALFQCGAWTVDEAQQWNECLDRFITETDAMLAPRAGGTP